MHNSSVVRQFCLNNCIDTILTIERYEIAGTPMFLATFTDYYANEDGGVVTRLYEGDSVEDAHRAHDRYLYSHSETI